MIFTSDLFQMSTSFTVCSETRVVVFYKNEKLDLFVEIHIEWAERVIDTLYIE